MSCVNNFDLEKIFSQRRNKVYAYMKENSISVALFEDSEDRRESAVRYLTGHPSDAAVILSAEGKCFLVPWDINLAKEKAHSDEIIPQEKFNRSTLTALKEILKTVNADSQRKLAMPPSTSFLQFQKFSSELKDWNLFVEEKSVHAHVVELRSCKDEYEIWCTKQACAITDEMTGIIIQNVKDGKFTLESDIALFVEKHLRLRNAERTSFDTLCAGPDRSWAIHAFPGYTNGEWGTRGLSLLDYGVCFEGYASDCTITVARNPNAEQKNILDLVQKAADECRAFYKAGALIHDAAQKADDIFAAGGKKMPHSLGHGTGLDIHEAPFISMRNTDGHFKVGNIITLEPGLYDQKLGGCRLENDVLITENGNELLTSSKIFYL